MENNSFVRTYCRWVINWQGKEALSLKEKSNKDCIFWDHGCTVYNVRPLQCISFPFWESILSSAKNWELAASGCPGMNTGKLHSEKAIGEYIKTLVREPIIKKGVSI